MTTGDPSAKLSQSSVDDAFTANLVHFVRYLRARGLALGPGTAGELAAVIDAVGLTSRLDLYLGLRSVVITRQTQRDLFDEAFDLFFGSGRAAATVVPVAGQSRDDRTAYRGSVPVLAPRIDHDDEQEIEEVSERAGGSYAERLAERDFGDLSPSERDEVQRLISRMVWRPADAASRRWAPGAGQRPDLRKTLRALNRPHGDLIPLEMAERRMRRRPLVVIADISGSMERYTEMFLYFVHAAQGRLGRVEAFVFATHLTRITRELRRREADAALSRIGKAVTDWSGGTRIGEALGTFNRLWSRRVTRGGAIGLVISDGWDTGDPDELDREMARFARSVHRVMWLNPLAGRQGFSPDTRGMRTVMPYVDDFMAAGTLVDLRGVVRLLESVPSRRGAPAR